MEWAFQYVAAKGIETEEDYPYTSGTTGENGTCTFDASKAQRFITGYKNVTANSTDALKAAIAAQPVSVAVAADDSWQFYDGHVFHGECGDGVDLDHGVLAVGYGTVQGEEAFIVKNSWTDSWGDNGYFYVSTDGTLNQGAGACKILEDNNYPTA